MADSMPFDVNPDPRRGRRLGTALLPTPLTSDDRTRPRNVRHGGARLIEEVTGNVAPRTLLPTPTSSDANMSGAPGYSTDSGRHEGVTLTDALVRGYRLPTPMAVNPSAQNQGSNKVNGPASLFEAVGLLPTPLSSKRGRRLKKRGGHDHTSVSLDEALLPTPTSSEATRGWAVRGANAQGGPSLGESLMPTPRARDWKGEGKDCLPPTPGQAGLRLNPCFVEWMMGWPPSWTATASSSSATASSRKPRRRRS